MCVCVDWESEPAGGEGWVVVGIRGGESRLLEKRRRGKEEEEEEPRVKHAALPDGDYDDAMTQGSPRQPHMYGDRNVTARNAVQSANGPFHLHSISSRRPLISAHLGHRGPRCSDVSGGRDLAHSFPVVCDGEFMIPRLGERVSEERGVVSGIR